MKRKNPHKLSRAERHKLNLYAMNMGATFVLVGIALYSIVAITFELGLSGFFAGLIILALALTALPTMPLERDDDGDE